MGQLGMSEDEFEVCTPRAFFNAVEGFELIRKMDLEVIRLQTLYSVNMWANNPISDPKKLWMYPWEKELKVIDIKKQRSKGRKLAEKWQIK